VIRGRGMTSHGLDVVRLSMSCTPIYVVPEGGSNQTLEDNNVVAIFICLTRSHTTLVIIPFLTRFYLWLTFPCMRIHTKNLNFRRRERASHEVWIGSACRAYRFLGSLLCQLSISGLSLLSFCCVREMSWRVFWRVASSCL
jgi:hypothetical protein